MDEDVIKTLMDDGVSIESENVEEYNVEKKEETVKKVEKIEKTLSEVEYAVLRCLEDTKNVRVISRIIGYPEFIVSKAIERLILKGYLDEDLNIIKSYEFKTKTKYVSEKNKLAVIDIAIAIAFLIFMIAIAYYFLT